VGLQQLVALDANADGTLGAQEAQGLSLWRDLNEDGRIASSEITALTHSNEGPLARKDWALRTQGLAITRTESPITPPSITGVPDAPATVQRLSPVVRSLQPFRPFSLNVPNPSSYRLLRDTDNVYNLPGGQFIPWSASQVKINYMNRDVMVGTDGNDAFDASYYSAYGSWFNLGPLARFMGGGGDDLVGGSNRADSIWGGTGNDGLWGYDGNDKLYGEEGDDEILGEAGNDTLDGGAGDDVLAGDSGNDIYRFGRGEGRDRIVQTEARADDQDVLQLADDITTDQLWFSRLGDDLVIEIVGTREGVVLTQWYTDESLRIDQIRTSNGGSLASRNVHQLVEAMAAFSPPAVGQMRISTQDTPNLMPVLASSWQNA